MNAVVLTYYLKRTNIFYDCEKLQCAIYICDYLLFYFNNNVKATRFAID